MSSMTSGERRAVVTLASLFSLRMIGLFMIMPVFALYGRELAGATPVLIGLGDRRVRAGAGHFADSIGPCWRIVWTVKS
jgi:hypothetical protein